MDGQNQDQSHDQNQDDEIPTPRSLEKEGSAVSRGSFWRTGLLLTTSAALGGIAVAVWNRRTLARMRQQSESRAAESWNDDEDFVD